MTKDQLKAAIDRAEDAAKEIRENLAVLPSETGWTLLIKPDGRPGEHTVKVESRDVEPLEPM